MKPSRHSQQEIDPNHGAAAWRLSLIGRTIVWTTIWALTFQPIIASAQVIADPTGGANRPQVETTANGLPIVQIVAPTAAGVSHNKYQQFNIDPQGLILNNSAVLTPTQQAGYVAGNPNLSSGSARIILNEVTSTNPSTLLGYTEVAGRKAEVVIANPNGITCNGCGFINTSRSILTTGVPIMGAGGSLDAFRVIGGNIAIQGAGLNAASLDQIDLIARSVQINAELWTNNLNVVSGANQVNYADLGVQVIAGTGGSPTVAIDVAALGGMYANKIRLIGTEAGVGVRSLGTVAAQAGDLDISSAGDITIGGNTGASGAVNLLAAQNLDVGSGGSIRAGTDTALSATGSLTNSGTVVAARNVTLNANNIASPGTLAAGIDSMGQLGTVGNLSVTATGTAMLGGDFYAAGDINVAGSAIDVRGANSASGGYQHYTAGNGNIEAANANLYAATDLTLTANVGSVNFATNSSFQSGGNLSVQQSADMNLSSLAPFKAAGLLALATNGAIAIGAGANLQASGATTLTAGNVFTNGGSLTAGSSLFIGATSISNTGTLTADSDLLLSVSGAFGNGGTIGVGNDINISSGTFANTGSLVASRDIVTQTAGTFTNSGALYAGRDQSHRATDFTNQPGGQIWAYRDIVMEGQTAGSNATSFTNDRATVDAFSGNLTIRADTLQNLGAQPAITRQTTSNPVDAVLYPDQGWAGGWLPAGALITSVSPNPWMYWYSYFTVDTVNPGFVANPGILRATGDINLYGNSIVNRMGQIAAGGNIGLWGGSFDNTGAQLYQIEEKYMMHNCYNCIVIFQGTSTQAIGSVPSTVSAGGSIVGNLSGGVTNASGSVPAPALQNTAVSVAAAPAIPGGSFNFAGIAIPTDPGLFRASQNANYLIETAPRFANLGSFLSSDYMLARLGLDPAQTQKRLGDGFYEQTLVLDEIAQLTGRRFLSDSRDAQAQYAALMDAGIRLAQSVHLAPGIALSAEQAAALTEDIVWLEDKIIAGQHVLVPVVYLAHDSSNLQLHGAALVAGNDIDITAGADIANGGAVIAGRDLRLAARDLTGSGGGLIAGRDLALAAVRDLTLAGVGLTAGGNASLSAGQDLALTESRQEIDRRQTFPTGWAQTRASLAQTGSIDAQGAVTLTAGRDLALRGEAVASKEGGIALAANRDVVVAEARDSIHNESHARSSHSGFLSSRQDSHDDRQDTETIHGSSLSGDTVSIVSGRDIGIKGSSIVGTNNVTLAAQGGISIEAAAEKRYSESIGSSSESGLFSSGGLSITLGNRSQKQTEQENDVFHVGSTLGSLRGDVNLLSGTGYRQLGSNVLAPEGSVNITAPSVEIGAVFDTMQNRQTFEAKQSGLTLSVSNPVVSAVQTAQQTSRAASQTSDPRMKALAVATAALAGKNAYDAVTKDPGQAGGINIGVSLGSSRSQSESSQSSSMAVGSNVAAGNNLTILATGTPAGGAGGEGNITVQGSTLSAGNDAILAATGDVNLLAAANNSSNQSNASSSGASVGVGFSLGKTPGLSVTASAYRSSDSGNGQDTTWTHTQVSAGNTLVIASGNDSNLKGAVASGKQVIADVGGNLSIESLQDTRTYQESGSSAGFSVSIPVWGTGFSASVNAGKTKINSDYQSANTQSGIQAGDNGFDITVQGNTDLKGAVIASTDKAVQENKNTLTTGTLTTSDLQNKAEYSGQSMSLGLGYSTPGNSVGTDQQGKPTTGAGQIPNTTLPSLNGFSATLPVAMNASGNAESTTRSAISGGQIGITDDAGQQALTGKDATQTVASVNRDTANASAPLAPIFDKEQVKAGFEITGAFVQQVGTFLENRAKATDQAKADLKKELDKPADQQDAAKIAQLTQAIQDNATWSMGGSGRTILTVVTAAASGNVTGSGGEMIQAAAVNYLQSLGVQEVKQIADSLMDDKGQPTTESEAVRTVLQGIGACAGATGQGQSCSTAALGASASVVINNLLAQTEGMTAEQKQARQNLVSSLVAGVAAAAGGDAAVANAAAQLELVNNGLVDDAINAAKRLSQKAGNGVAKLMDKITVKALVDNKEAIKSYLDAKAAQGGLSETEIAFLATLYAADEALFPTTLLDVPGVSKAISTAGKLVKAGVAAEDAVKVAAVEAKALSIKAAEFERSLVNLAPGERVATVKQAAKDMAKSNGWEKDNRLSRINDRDVYTAPDGSLYSLDTQHGAWEKINPKNGAHEGEFRLLDLDPTKPADLSGGHNLKVN